MKNCVTHHMCDCVQERLKSAEDIVARLAMAMTSLQLHAAIARAREHFEKYKHSTETKE